MEKVDKVLTKETPIIINARFYCLKLMRKSLTLKELQTNYIKATHANWVLKMKDIFEEVESRALLVPNEFDCGVTPEMVSMMNEFTESQGGKV